ncbi:MAG: radical SAM protein [Nanoarchaeota archaeon]|nr:radical SAM protein [Nanoarchaeota archaeon]
MKINEIFLSIQGEGLEMGLPTVFVRTSDCNLRCNYCDTTYAYNESKELSVKEIFAIIEDFGIKRVSITGGEPLLQKEELLQLIEKLEDYSISVETNGSIDVSRLPENIKISLDIKCPSSGESNKMRYDNLNHLKISDQVKFIMATDEDYNYAKAIVEKFNVPNVFFTPVGGLDAQKIVKKVLKDKLNLRIGLQLHKIIWNKDLRGV